MNEDKPHLHVEFYTEAQEDIAASRAEGRPIFRDVEMVKIQIAGDPKNNLIAPAHDATKRNPETGQPMTWAEQFPDHYRYFKDNADQQRGSGTPLSEVPWLTASKRAELKALKIHTVDALAMLDGTALQRLGMGGRELKNKAVAWLDKAAGNAAESRLAEELAARDREIEALKEQMAMLAAGKAPVTEQPKADLAYTTDDGPWMAYSDEDIKNFIADRAGRRPAGNPKRETLIAQANEILAAEKEAA